MGVEIRDFMFLGKTTAEPPTFGGGWVLVGKSGYPPETPQQVREQAWGTEYWELPGLE